MSHHPFLLPSSWGLLVIDIQEKLAAAMPSESWPRFERSVKNLIYLAQLTKKPVVVSEQYPKGLGETVSSLKEELSQDSWERVEKVEFSCWRNDSCRKALQGAGVNAWVLVGMEAHICVCQTALDLLHEGFSVFLPYDGVLSRREEDRGCALDYLEMAGVRIVSSEMVIYQTLEKAGTEEFKKMLPRVQPL